LLLAHEELLKSQTTLSIAENEKAEDLRELVGMRVQLEERFELEHTATMLMQLLLLKPTIHCSCGRKPQIGRPSLMQCYALVWAIWIQEMQFRNT